MAQHLIIAMAEVLLGMWAIWLVEGDEWSLPAAVREWLGDVVTAVRGWWGVTGRHVAMGAYHGRHELGAAA